MSMLREIEIRTICIKLIDGTKINGQVNINREQGYDRLSDLLETNNEPFLIVFNATQYENGFDSPVKPPTIFVNKRHIVWATPDEDQR